MKKTPSAARVREAARRYLSVVEWSDEDGCYVGSARPLVGQCCHGKTPAAVLSQLETIVEEWVTLLLSEGKPLPASLGEKEFSGKFVVRVPKDVHRKAALKAMARGESLNQYVSELLAKA